MTLLFESASAPDEVELRERMISRLLYENYCMVKFKKVNGDIREMPCTLKAEALPPIENDKLHQTRLYEPKTISVWCLDKMAWRSFRTMNVIEVRAMTPEDHAAAAR